MNKQPMTLRVADAVENLQLLVKVTNEQAAKELRRLHEVNQELYEALDHYADQYCEGWCKESEGLFKDCGGCKARVALAKARGEQ